MTKAIRTLNYIATKGVYEVRVIRRGYPFKITVITNELDKGHWKAGSCAETDCKVKGQFWNGGNREEHYCIEHSGR